MGQGLWQIGALARMFRLGLGNVTGGDDGIQGVAAPQQVYGLLRFLTGAGSLRGDAGAGEAIAKRRPQDGLDAVAASWTIEGEEDGCAQHPPARRVSHPDLLVLRVWPGGRRPGLAKGRGRRYRRASGAAGAALIYNKGQFGTRRGGPFVLSR